MANVKIVFDPGNETGNETELALPDAIGARLVTAFAKFTQGGEAPTTRFKVDEASSFFVDFRKVSMVMNGAPAGGQTSSARRSKRG